MAKSKSEKANREELVLKQIGERILSLREKSGKSQSEFSYQIGWDKPNIRNIEKGRRNFTIRTLIKICESLNITMAELFDNIK